MKKDAFLWLTIGLGIGMLTSAVITYKFYMDEQTRKQDPRLGRVERLLDEAEQLLDVGKKAAH
ncbi:MAG: hypothetical protein K8T10_12535 [Candidatus Eremiobacteraeota bacterium]|nr:hypothetical protein [Candidatus Eremiobacteraeota bacterium]